MTKKAKTLKERALTARGTVDFSSQVRRLMLATGASQATVYRWMAGVVPSRQGDREAIAHVYRTTPEELWPESYGRRGRR